MFFWNILRIYIYSYKVIQTVTADNYVCKHTNIALVFTKFDYNYRHIIMLFGISHKGIEIIRKFM